MENGFVYKRGGSVSLHDYGVERVRSLAVSGFLKSCDLPSHEFHGQFRRLLLA